MRGRENPERANENSEEGGGSEVSNLRVYNEHNKMVKTTKYSTAVKLYNLLLLFSESDF